MNAINASQFAAMGDQITKAVITHFDQRFEREVLDRIKFELHHQLHKLGSDEIHAMIADTVKQYVAIEVKVRKVGKK